MVMLTLIDSTLTKLGAYTVVTLSVLNRLFRVLNKVRTADGNGS